MFERKQGDSNPIAESKTFVRDGRIRWWCIKYGLLEVVVAAAVVVVDAAFAVIGE